MVFEAGRIRAARRPRNRRLPRLFDGQWGSAIAAARLHHQAQAGRWFQATGCSREARQGDDVLSLFGPLGSAVLEPSLGHDLLIVVGGSGLGVALSILARAAGTWVISVPITARLFFGVRTMRDAAALQQIRACGGSASARISK